ncbi:Histone-lysine N-methyltransferase setd3 [Zostera marina]|uniref:Histone-lysine N-methyltransferase setd3 n=1 Tax=Zostera marina TaxID=29655 RepID=A0A0K9PYW6_ZOSMR|nr:Histone-lysine N-methyltransferase setd3 [Zostera marina]
MATAAASKLLTATAGVLTSSTSTLTHRRPLTCASGSHSPRLTPKPQDLIKWVRSKGGFVHPQLKIADHSSHGLGLVSDGVIPSGSELVSLPDHLTLRLRWSDDAQDWSDRPNSPLFQLVHRVPEELWAMRLGLKLLRERATVGSFWWPYISNLPEAFTMPIFFSGEEIKSLQYAPLLHQVNKRCRFLLDFEKEVKHLLMETTPETHPFCGQDVDSSSLGWAMSAVSSRAFRLHNLNAQDSVGANVPMLLPVIDMCNHSFHSNARIIQEQNSGNKKMLVQVIADTQVEHNAPITLNYGCLSNDLFLLDYGFVIPSNPYDHIELRYDGSLLDASTMVSGVSSPSFSSPAPWQEKIISQLGLYGNDALLKVTLGGLDLVDGRLLAALRVLLASNVEHVEKHSLDALKSLSEDAPLGLSNETAALRTIVALCAITLHHFPTKVMADEVILKRSDTTSSMKLAIEFRVQKKLMVVDLMTKLSKILRQLTDRQKLG